MIKTPLSGSPNRNNSEKNTIILTDFLFIIAKNIKVINIARVNPKIPVKLLLKTIDKIGNRTKYCNLGLSLNLKK